MTGVSYDAPEGSGKTWEYVPQVLEWHRRRDLRCWIAERLYGLAHRIAWIADRIDHPTCHQAHDIDMATFTFERIDP